MAFTCSHPGCGRTFTRLDNLKRHEDGHGVEKNFQCSKCSRGFNRQDNHRRHEEKCRGEQQQQQQTQRQQSSGSGLKRSSSGRVVIPSNQFKVTKTATAFSNACVTWKLKYRQNNGHGYMDILDSSTTAMKGYLQRYQQNRNALKFNMALHVVFEKSTDSSDVTDPPAVLITEQFEIYSDTDVDELLNLCAKQLENRIESYEGTGSGWIFSKLVALDTTVWQLDPLRASTYHPLPKWVQRTKCVVNVKNKDQQCFKWAVLATLFKPNGRQSRVSSYKACEYYKDAPDFSMLTFPVSLKDINKFEKANNISVNVYAIDESKKKCEGDKKMEDESSATTRQGDVDSITEEPTTSRKRKRHSNKSSSKRRRCDFIDDEADASDDEGSDDDEGGYVSDLIDDDEESVDDLSLYRALDQQREVDEMQQPLDIDDVEDDESDDDEQQGVTHASNSTKEERGVVYPVRVTKEELTRHINLLLTEKDEVWHYSTIKNFSGFLRSQYSKHTGGYGYFYCYTCLHGFAAKKNEKIRSDCQLLTEHVKYCKTLKPQRVSYPEKGITEFTSIRKQLMHPFVGYADFESVLKPISEQDVSTGIVPPSEMKEGEKKEALYQSHSAASYWTKFVSIDPEFDLPQRHNFEFPQKDTYVGEDAAEHFLDYVQAVADSIYKKYIRKPKEMVFTTEDEKNFEAANECHICGEGLIRAYAHCHDENEDETNCTMCDVNKKADVIHKDHCHILGHFRGAAHAKCNVNYRIDHWKLPIFFHNLRGYDGHLLIRAVKERHGSVRVIPNNMERYMAISIGQVQFLDSLQFTMKSLDDLVSTMNEGDFKYTKQHFTTDHQLNLMKQKGIFPYDFFDDLSKLAYDKFPSQETFYNKLVDNKCTTKDYLRAKLVWDTFNCKTMKDYHDLYLKSDVLLLADFFEKFRKMCMTNYGVDAAHYYSAPGMAWDAALKLTKVKLELFDNEMMYTFMERSIRGGISQISKRYAKANNQQCRDYDQTRPTTHLIYLDANNLYGWAMSQFLPTGGFEWLSDEEIATIVIRAMSDEEPTGHIFEVDLTYPKELHDRHSDYPLAPERLTIDESMFSELQVNFPAYKKKPTTKLTPNLYDKKNYVVHYRNLKFYLEQGMVVTKIHRVLKFDQSPWLKEYIDYNTRQRAASTSDFAKDFYKLMNNSVFGKTQENLRNRVNVEVITDRKVALKRVSKPSFKRSQIIKEDLVTIQIVVSNLVLDKPVYVGFSVLELSKLWMYKFHYSKMLTKYGDKIWLCFTDTDSLLYEIQTENIFNDMLGDDDYDTSEYPFNHPLYSGQNKKIIGKFKDELNGRPLEEFAGVLPKCYSLLFHGRVRRNVVIDEDINEKQTAKGTKESVKKEHLRHHHYKEVLNSLTTLTIKQNTIRSKAHAIGTYHQKKVALTAFDTKRWILNDNIHTLAHGHYKT